MNTLIVPKLRDPRFLILCFFAVLIVYIYTSPGFARTWQQLLLSSTVAITLDLGLTYYLRRKWVFPMSGLITSIGIFVLIDSPIVWATGLAAAIGILSKHFIRINGSHIFNPNNFGVVLTCWAFPEWIVSGGFRWGGKILLTALLFSIGTAVVIRAQRWAASFSYLTAFLVFNVIRSFIFAKPFYVFSLSLLGPAMQLFIFYMVSDPRTSPNDRRRQVIYGVSIAFVDNVFRQMQLRESPLLACFVVCLFFNLYRAFKPDREAFTIWQTRELGLRAS